MECPKCGADNAAGAAFCSLCYERFPAASGAGGSLTTPGQRKGHGIGAKVGAPRAAGAAGPQIDCNDPAVRAGLLDEKSGALHADDVVSAVDTAGDVIGLGMIVGGLLDAVSSFDGD
ncbi:MAG: zinc ribbon domain-containing protein [Coriobacteriia bacterium]|nr:zinc ribbon domain-containing protein [Coriobacteriia bacterium]